MKLYQIHYIMDDRRIVSSVCFPTKNAARGYIKKEYANCDISFDIPINDVTPVHIFTKKRKCFGALIEPIEVVG